MSESEALIVNIFIFKSTVYRISFYICVIYCNKKLSIMKKGIEEKKCIRNVYRVSRGTRENPQKRFRCMLIKTVPYYREPNAANAI